jgi:hypothetical protein
VNGNTYYLNGVNNYYNLFQNYIINNLNNFIQYVNNSYNNILKICTSTIFNQSNLLFILSNINIDYYVFIMNNNNFNVLVNNLYGIYDNNLNKLYTDNHGNIIKFNVTYIENNYIIVNTIDFLYLNNLNSNMYLINIDNNGNIIGSLNTNNLISNYVTGFDNLEILSPTVSFNLLFSYIQFNNNNKILDFYGLLLHFIIYIG